MMAVTMACIQLWFNNLKDNQHELLETGVKVSRHLTSLQVNMWIFQVPEVFIQPGLLTKCN